MLDSGSAQSHRPRPRALPDLDMTKLAKKKSAGREERKVSIPARDVSLEGELHVPENAQGIVLFAHGSGSSRHSVRNRFVAEALRRAGLATLLFDLLSAEEESVDVQTAHLRFDIAYLAERLVHAVDWAARQPETDTLPIGLFGSSTGAAAALVTAAERPRLIGAVVSRGGRPDLAEEALPIVEAPTLLIVGGRDRAVIELNQRALKALRCQRQIEIVPGAAHLFEEPGSLEQVASLAATWFAVQL